MTTHKKLSALTTILMAFDCEGYYFSHIDSSMAKVNPYNWVAGAFLWNNTPQGAEHWADVNTIWRKVLKKYESYEK